MKSLSELTGGKYQLKLEESWYYEYKQIRQPNRRWYEQIPVKGGGFISLYAEEPAIILKLSIPRIKTAYKIYRHLLKEPAFQADFLKGKFNQSRLNVYQDEAVIYFPGELFPIIAEMAGARKKRKLTPEHKARLLKGLSTYRSTH